MVSDSELIQRLREFLSTSDLDTTTNAIVRHQLEEDFGIDLSDRKAFIREQIDIYMQSQFENVDDNPEEANEEVEEVVEEGEQEEEEEEEEEEESTPSSKAKSSSKKRPKHNEEVKKRGGFTKLCSLSPELQKFTGVPELARTEVVKQMWKYIKENNLQNPSNKRKIICDDTLRNLFRVDTIDMFQMNKVLTKHIWPLDSDNAAPSPAPAPAPPKEKQLKKPKEKQLKKRAKTEEQDEQPKRKEKRKRSGNSAFLVPLKLSDALVKFLGSGESELTRSDVIKRIWKYIKLNNLQDPSDRRQIICDEKLKELFDVDTFRGFTVAKLLTTHFIKPEQ